MKSTLPMLIVFLLLISFDMFCQDSRLECYCDYSVTVTNFTKNVQCDDVVRFRVEDLSTSYATPWWYMFWSGANPDSALVKENVDCRTVLRMLIDIEDPGENEIYEINHTDVFVEGVYTRVCYYTGGSDTFTTEFEVGTPPLGIKKRNAGIIIQAADNGYTTITNNNNID